MRSAGIEQFQFPVIVVGRLRMGEVRVSSRSKLFHAAMIVFEQCDVREEELGGLLCIFLSVAAWSWIALCASTNQNLYDTHLGPQVSSAANACGLVAAWSGGPSVHASASRVDSCFEV